MNYGLSLLLLLCLTLPASAELWVVENATLSGMNNVAAPGLDVYHIKCPSAGNLWAIVDVPQNHDVPNADRQAFHITTLCTKPEGRLGFGDKETADGIIWPNSDKADVGNCREALVAVECDVNSPCTFPYRLVGNCQFGTVLPGFDTPIINR